MILCQVQLIASIHLYGTTQYNKSFPIDCSQSLLSPGSKYDMYNEGIFSYCSDLELVRWCILAVRRLGLPGSAVVLVKWVPEGRFWREVVDRRLVLR